MTTTHKTCMAGIALMTAAIMIGLWAGSDADEQSLQPEVASNQLTPAEAATKPAQKKIGDVWQWIKPAPLGRAEKTAPPESETSVPEYHFDIAKIHAALKEIKLDDAGNIVPDHDALSALNDAFQYGNQIMGDRALADFQQIVKVALPSPAGEQAAAIIGDYNDYLRARKDMLAMMVTPDQGLNDEAGFEELAALRNIYLGQDVAGKMFAREDALSRHMMESMQIEGDASLSLDEKRIQQQSVSERYADAETGIENWQFRYQQFLQDKQLITAARYAQEDEQAQVSALLHYHFSLDELKNIAHLNLDTQ